MNIKALIFLGNPGQEYSCTRHNIGWMVLQHLSFYSQLVWKKKFNGQFSQFRMGNEILYLLKPETFMNNSGKSVTAFLKFFKIKPEESLVIHDDLELDYGTVALKTGGGLGGHNGLRSIKSVLGTSDFIRFRLGISRPVKGTVSSYVLSRFSAEQEIALPDYLTGAGAILSNQLSQNCKPLPFKKKII